MKQVVIIFILCLLFWNCDAQTEHDLTIPDQIAVDKVKSTSRFPGTNTFIHIPADYYLVKQLIRFQKNEQTYIQIMQIPAPSNFEAKRKEMDNYFQNAVAAGKLQKEYYKKEFKLGDYSALLYYGKDYHKPGLEQMVLLFGDNTFVNMVVGEFPSGQPLIKKEILAGLLSLYVDKSVTVDPSELANFTLKTDNTEFKFFGSASQMFYYSIGGKGDPIQNSFEDQIMIMSLPQMQQEQIRSYGNNMIYRYRTLGMRIPSYSSKDTTINGNFAYEITFEGSFQGKKNYVYQIVTGNQNGSVLFLGGLYNRLELMLQIRSIAATLQLK